MGVLENLMLCSIHLIAFPLYIFTIRKLSVNQACHSVSAFLKLLLFSFIHVLFFLSSLASFLTYHLQLTHGIPLGYFLVDICWKLPAAILVSVETFCCSLTFLSKHFIFKLFLIILFPIFFATNSFLCS